MRKLLLKKISQIAFILLLISTISCSDSTPKNQLSVDIPTQLQAYPEVVAYIESMAETAQHFSSLTNDLAKLTGGKNVTDASELTAMQALKMGKIALKMTQISSKMEEYENQRSALVKNLSLEEIAAFDAVLLTIEAQMGKIDKANLANNDDAMPIIEESEEESTNTIETEGLPTDEEQAEMDIIIAERQMENEGENTVSDEQEFSFLHLLFPLAIIGLMVFFAIQKIKKFKNKTQDIGYAFGNIKNTAQTILDSEKKSKGSEKTLSPEEKEGLEKLMNVFDKTSEK